MFYNILSDICCIYYSLYTLFGCNIRNLKRIHEGNFWKAFNKTSIIKKIDFIFLKLQMLDDVLDALSNFLLLSKVNGRVVKMEMLGILLA